LKKLLKQLKTNVSMAFFDCVENFPT